MSVYDIKSAENPDNALEKKHVPIIDAPDTVKKDEPFEVTVKMGEIDHPAEEGHFIQYVELYAEYYQLVRANFTSEVRPEATFTIKLQESCTLRAFEYCNLHGQWEAEKEITVE